MRNGEIVLTPPAPAAKTRLVRDELTGILVLASPPGTPPLTGDRLPARVQTPAQTTDGHLLALAAKHGAELAALDPGLPGALLIG